MLHNIINIRRQLHQNCLNPMLRIQIAYGIYKLLEARNYYYMSMPSSTYNLPQIHHKFISTFIACIILDNEPNLALDSIYLMKSVTKKVSLGITGNHCSKTLLVPLLPRPEKLGKGPLFCIFHKRN